MSGFRQLIRGDSNFNIIARAKVWAIVSGIVLLLSLVGIFGRDLNLGLEFKGGTSLTATLNKTVTVGQVTDALKEFNLGEPKVQIQTAGNSTLKEVLVRTKHIADRDTLTRVQTKLAEVAGQTGPGGTANPDAVSINDVGPTWGKQISNKAFRGLIVFLILVTLYISLRFEPKMAVGALIALFHDLLATAGIYALIGFEVTPATVIALLTLLGYSLYDTVVVFDKVQENTATTGQPGRENYTAMVNRSVNQVMMRSINTSLSTLLPIGALLFVGVYLFHADTLKDLALALFLGTVVGTYSSIFVASPILALLKEREPRYKAIRARGATGGTRAARRAAAAAASPVVADGPALESSGMVAPAGSGRSTTGARPPVKPRKRKGNKRR